MVTHIPPPLLGHVVLISSSAPWDSQSLQRVILLASCDVVDAVAIVDGSDGAAADGVDDAGGGGGDGGGGGPAIICLLGMTSHDAINGANGVDADGATAIVAAAVVLIVVVVVIVVAAADDAAADLDAFAAADPARRRLAAGGLVVPPRLVVSGSGGADDDDGSGGGDGAGEGGDCVGGGGGGGGGGGACAIIVVMHRGCTISPSKARLEDVVKESNVARSAALMMRVLRLLSARLARVICDSRCSGNL